MKKIIFLFICLCFFINITQAVKVYFHYAPFYAPSYGSYIETYLAIDPSSVAYKLNANNKLQAKIEVTMLFKNAEEIREYRKYNVISPEVDTANLKNMPYGFIDLQRIPIPNGIYNFELSIIDIYAEDSVVFNYADLVTVLIPEEEMSFSGIEPAERFMPSTTVTQYTKSGYEVIPYVSNFYPNGVNHLSFYAELYHSDKSIGLDSSFMIRYYISSVPSRRIFENSISFDRRKAAPILVIAKTIDITNLPSGNYNLEIEVRNRNNELLLIKKHFFQRSNTRIVDAPTDFSSVNLQNSWVTKYNTVYELAAYIRSLYPIAGRVERNYIDSDFRASDLKTMQQFFLNFWESRNNISPEDEWNLYNQQVKLVDKLFGNQVKKGYQTDRGRVYLQYGTPNQIIKRENLSSFLPYEIWHYYRINDKNNRRFVFCLTSIGTQDYELIQSDMDGEISSSDWMDMMKGRNAETESGSTYNDEYQQLRRDYQD